MVRVLALGLVIVSLAACGSGRSGGVTSARSPVYNPSLFASGPISQACLRGGRDQASRARCGCVQAVANRHLSAADQRRGAAFFNDPQSAQDTRQSDNPSSERFWLRWKEFGASAGQLCT
ncbi:MAG: hypothetical protein ABJN14_01490 [Paracoccaceae bacterium]